MDTDHDEEQRIPTRLVDILADFAELWGAWLIVAAVGGALTWLYSGNVMSACSVSVFVLAACVAAFGWRVEGLILSLSGAVAAMGVATAFIPAQWQLPLFAAAVAGAGILGWGITGVCLPRWRWIPVASFTAAIAHVFVLPWWAIALAACLAGSAAWRMKGLFGAVLSSLVAGALASAGARLAGISVPIQTWYILAVVAGAGFGVQWYALRTAGLSERLWWLEAGCLGGGAVAHVVWAVSTTMWSWTAISQATLDWRNGMSGGLIAGALLLGVTLAGVIRIVCSVRPNTQPYPYLFAVSLILAAAVSIHGVLSASLVTALFLAGVAVDAFGLVVEPCRPSGDQDAEQDEGVEYGE